MSELRPRGIPIIIDGIERHFLFTLNAIDAIQDKTGKSIHEVLKGLTETETAGQTVKELTLVLLNDEAEREKYKNPDCCLLEVTEQEVGWMVGMDNLMEVTTALLRAYGYSMPEPEGEEDPNQRSEQRRNS